MDKKRNWLEPNSLKLLTTTESSDLNISWSSSDTDDEFYLNYKKRISETSKMTDLKQLNPPEEIEATPPILDMNSLSQSPIIGKNLLGEASPTFNERSSDELNKSPVIGKNVKVKNWKKRKKNQQLGSSNLSTDKKEIDTIDQFNISVFTSSDSSQIQSSLSVIHLANDRDNRDEKELAIEAISQISDDIFSIDIDWITTQNNNSHVEEEISISQYSSTQRSYTLEINEIKTDDNCESTASSSCCTTPSNAVLFYNKAPKRQRFKKGGLRKKLQKALRNKEASISIWKHEMYLNRADFYIDFLHLQVRKVSVEFGNRLFECELINDGCTDKCLVVLNSLIDETARCPRSLKLYKPYSVLKVKYVEEDVRCYYNICKILFDD